MAKRKGKRKNNEFTKHMEDRGIDPGDFEELKELLMYGPVKAKEWDEVSHWLDQQKLPREKDGKPLSLLGRVSRQGQTRPQEEEMCLKGDLIDMESDLGGKQSPLFQVYQDITVEGNEIEFNGLNLTVDPMRGVSFVMRYHQALKDLEFNSGTGIINYKGKEVPTIIWLWLSLCELPLSKSELGKNPTAKIAFKTAHELGWLHCEDGQPTNPIRWSPSGQAVIDMIRKMGVKMDVLGHLIAKDQ